LKYSYPPHATETRDTCLPAHIREGEVGKIVLIQKNKKKIKFEELYNNLGKKIPY